MKKFYSLLAAMFVSGIGVATAADLGPATIAEGPENGGEYLEYQSELVVTWGDETLAFASDDPSFNIYVVEFAYPDDPDSFTLSDCEVVNVGRGIRNGIRFTFDNITSKIDYSNYFGPRLTKYGEFTLTIPEGLVTSNGIPNPTQQISWKQVEELSDTPDDPGNSGDPEVNITLSEVTPTSFTATFTPNDLVSRYYVYCATGSLEEEYEMWQIFPGVNSISDMIVTFAWYDHTGVYTETWDADWGVAPGTDYEIGVVMYDMDGEQLPYKSLALSTPLATDEPMSYTIDEVTTSSVTVTFLPSSDVAEYYFFGSSLSIDMNWMFAQMWGGYSSISEMIEVYSYDFGGAHSGEVTYKFTEEMVPGQPYYIGVASKDASGNYIEPYIEIVADFSTGVNTLENESIYRVYDIKGNKVTEGSDLNGLKKGIYIINGKKVMIK